MSKLSIKKLGLLTDTFHNNGKEYKENVKPAIEVIGGDHFFDHQKDEKIKAALKWLRKQS